MHKRFSHHDLLINLCGIDHLLNRFCSAREIASSLGVHPSTVYEWHRRWKITGHYIDGKLRFDYEEVVLQLRLWKKRVERGELA